MYFMIFSFPTSLDRIKGMSEFILRNAYVSTRKILLTQSTKITLAEQASIRFNLPTPVFIMQFASVRRMKQDVIRKASAVTKNKYHSALY